MRNLLLSVSLILVGFSLQAQHSGYSFKFGPVMGIQQWNSSDRGPLFAYHADVQIENISETDARTLYAGLGFHQRGSANRVTYNTIGGQRIQNTTKFIFNNAVLTAGGKQIYALQNMQGHVSLALRGEVNISTSFGEDDDVVRNNPGLLSSYPQDGFVNRFLYGIDIGAGIDLPLTPSLDGLLEIRVSPDLSRQYFQPAFSGPDIFQIGQNRNYPERRINNITFELSFGIRLIRYSE
ncbi:MAG: hypothetical protein AB8F78_04695 [Saprospiraceae bacterium]